MPKFNDSIHCSLLDLTIDCDSYVEDLRKLWGVPDPKKMNRKTLRKYLKK